MKYKKHLLMLSTALLLQACNNEGTTNAISNIPVEYNHKVINNQGLVVESKLDNYTISILSTSLQEANPQARHQGVVVKINGKNSKTMPIEASYLGKKILIVVKDERGKRVAVSPEIEVTDVPVIVVALSI